MRHLLFCGMLVMLLSVGPALAIAQDDPEPDFSSLDDDTSNSEEVAAVINGESITLKEVNEAVDSVLQQRTVGAEARKMVQAEVLSQLIDRTLILQKLTKEGNAATPAEVAESMKQLRKQAVDNKIDFDKSIAERGLTEDKLKEQVAWQLTWGKFLQGKLTDAELRSYFEAHRQEFDGSELRISHVLLRPDTTSGAAETARLTALANDLREQIESGKLTFAEAAKQHSAGPSRHKGGDLGFIPRQGLMLEAFAAAAFKLKKGQISEPVTSPYGVHLIQVTDVKPGRKLWLEVKEQLQAPASQAYFEKLAAVERKEASIEFTGKSPHFKPGTRELATE